MSASCALCARRGELLVRLGVSLDFRASDMRRLWETLELPDEQLIAALAGRKREELREWHASAATRSDQMPKGERGQAVHEPAGDLERVCRHREDYPVALRKERLAPPELHVAGGLARLKKLLESPAVAIGGARRCTDYGMEVARCLGRDLAAAGLCVISELCDGIAYGAQLGALEAGGACIAVMAGGLGQRSPRSCAALYRRVTAAGCVVSELPWSARARVWSQASRARIVGLLAQLVILVEAEPDSRELASARLARERGKSVAAVPGRITSPTSVGTNGLLKEGAALVGGAADALDLLYGARPTETPPTAKPDRPVVDRRLDALLRRIDEGKDTISELGAEHESPDAVWRELAELELEGLVRRGDGGRYVPCTVAVCG